ncbi:MAG: cyclic-di-AMP receptor [Oscillospiraceae bacterium]|nr:cyclic-di-AMP receptor [Oscillospiraceae bacterium]
MKMILAIVHKDDSSTVSHALTRSGFFVTKLSTSGGFLQAGNTTFIVGVEAERVDEALKVIEQHCKKRTQIVDSSIYAGMSATADYPVEVTVGGATIFVTDVERFEKI